MVEETGVSRVLIASVLLGFLGGCPSLEPGPSEAGSTGGAPATTGLATTDPSGPNQTDSAPTMVPTDKDSTTSGPPDGSDGCCEAHAGPGCEEASVQDCVCQVDPSCCAFEWSQTCSDVAQSSCDATCRPDGTDTDGSDTDGSDTDAPDTDGRTTDDSTTDPGGTFGSTFGTSGSGGEQPSPCCAGEGGVGCFHEPTEECVCAIDASCCDTAWTDTCVGVATDSCNACTTDDCCAPQGDAGCSDETIESCVCDADAFCCDEMWDGICIEVAVELCKADCTV